MMNGSWCSKNSQRGLAFVLCILCRVTGVFPLCLNVRISHGISLLISNLMPTSSPHPQESVEEAERCRI